MTRRIATLMTLALITPFTALADNCPADPLKTEPGVCGCGVVDTDWDSDGDADSCIDPFATVAPDALVGFGARVDAGAVVSTGVVLGAYSHVGSNSQIGQGAIIGTRASIGQSSSVGAGSVVSRRSTVGDGVTLGDDAVLGRGVTIPDGLVVGGTGQLAIGYGADLGPSLQSVGERTTIGSFANVDANAVGSDVVMARSVQVGTGADIQDGVIIGPNGNIATLATLGSGVRLRKDTSIGASSHVGADARISRGAVVASGVCIGTNASIGARATLEQWSSIEADTHIPSGDTVAGEATPPSCTGSFDSAVRFVNATDNIRTPVNTGLGNQYTIEARIFLDSYEGGVSNLWNEWTYGQEDKTLIVRPGYMYGFGFPSPSGITATSSAITESQWHHVAFVCNGSNRYLFLNGQILAQDSACTSTGNSSGLGFIGGRGRESGIFWQSFKGYLDTFRISTTARYTTPFTPPAGDLSSDADTVLLYNFEAGDFYTDGTTVRVQDRGPLFPNGHDGELATGFGYSTAPEYPQ